MRPHFFNIAALANRPKPSKLTVAAIKAPHCLYNYIGPPQIAADVNKAHSETPSTRSSRQTERLSQP